MFTKTRTRTENTEQKYKTCSSRLFKRFERVTHRPFKNNYYEFFSWLMTMKEAWAKSTWIYNKSALRFVASTHGLRALNRMLENTDNNGGKGKPKHLPPAERRSSAKKAKHISQKAFKKILNSFQMLVNNYWATCGFYIFVSSYYVGLRPCEYASAQIIYDKNRHGKTSIVLRVKNAKHTNGRAHGEYRHIPLDYFNEGIINVIIHTIKLCKSPKDAHGREISSSKFTSYASTAFTQFTKKLFPNRKTTITLYTARHQFCANLKRAGLLSIEIGALMGHCTDATSMTSYGKKRFGRSSMFIPKPLQEEVAKVTCSGRHTNYFKTSKEVKPHTKSSTKSSMPTLN